jgi:hypothetical protein
MTIMNLDKAGPRCDMIRHVRKVGIASWNG